MALRTPRSARKPWLVVPAAAGGGAAEAGGAASGGGAAAAVPTTTVRASFICPLSGVGHVVALVVPRAARAIRLRSLRPRAAVSWLAFAAVGGTDQPTVSPSTANRSTRAAAPARRRAETCPV